MSRRSDKAEKKYRRNAEMGDPVAQFYLGHAYYLDAKEASDIAHALIWIRKAADQDYDVALAHLGYMHLLGYGVPVDCSEARSWFRKAAEQGDAHHQYTYGTMCWNGDFGPLDPKEAETWWLKAAEQAMAEAHWALGCYYTEGPRTRPVRNCIKGYMWYTLAALQDKPGHSPEAARTARDRVAENMTSKQVAEAENRVQGWLEEHSKLVSEDLIKHWRERIADPLKPLTPKEAAKARARFRKTMEKLSRRYKERRILPPHPK